ARSKRAPAPQTGAGGRVRGSRGSRQYPHDLPQELRSRYGGHRLRGRRTRAFRANAQKLPFANSPSQGVGADHRGRRLSRTAVGSASSRKQHHGGAGKREGKDRKGDRLEASVTRRSS